VDWDKGGLILANGKGGPLLVVTGIEGSWLKPGIGLDEGDGITISGWDMLSRRDGSATIGDSGPRKLPQ
jgi:hypothetical protein